MNEAYVALGSNLGDREGNVASAVAALETIPETTVLAVSSLYESEPWGPVQEQDPYANAVAHVRTGLSATQLLDQLQEVEESMGRVRTQRFGPRVIDLDLLLYGDDEWESDRLTLPHPRMAERDFVITPLLEIAPHVRFPDGTPVTRAGVRVGRVVGRLGEVEGAHRIHARESGVSEDLYSEESFSEDPVSVATTFDVDALRETMSNSPASFPDEWVPVGPSRFEWLPGNSSPDFRLLFWESLLLQEGIPCRFWPHMPNQGFMDRPAFGVEVTLRVPPEYAERATALVAEFEAAG